MLEIDITSCPSIGETLLKTKLQIGRTPMPFSFPVACRICAQSIQLEECKIDEHGQPVHEHCQYMRLSLNAPTGDGSPPPASDEP